MAFIGCTSQSQHAQMHDRGCQQVLAGHIEEEIKQACNWNILK